MCAKTFHPLCALVAYTVVTSLVFAGLLNSGFTMFNVVNFPECMSGTTSTLYNDKPRYSAPSGKVPFCSKDALANAYAIGFGAYGYLGISEGVTDVFTSQTIMTTTYYCFAKSNQTCPNWESDGLTSFTVKFLGAGGQFQFFDPKARDKLRAMAGGQFSGESSPGLSKFNNFPIKFGTANLPSGLDASKTYYFRGDVFDPRFQIADDTSSPPKKIDAIAGTGDISFTIQMFAGCPSQKNALASFSTAESSNVNDDGTLKTGSCGYCLTQPLMTGWVAVPGLCGVTITLLLILEIMMIIPAARKLAFFRILFIVVSVICLIFLIAAVGAGATMFLETAKCRGITDFTQAQMMPSPDGRDKINGYTPSKGGASLIESSGRGSYDSMQGSGPAAWMSPYLIPSIGAVQLIIAIVFLFVFTIVFTIKTDWAAVTSNGDAGTTMVSPH